jgi:hypothetical protein
MTDALTALRRIPAHIAVMLGLSTAAYAVTLAGVAADQSQADAATAAARAPALAAVDSLTRANDDADAALGRADGLLADLGRAYDEAGGRLAALEAALAGFAGSVTEINGVSRALPASVPLPAVTTTSRSSVPATHTTTGASGGG